MVLCPRELARHFSAVEQVLTNRFRIGTNVNLRVLRKYASSSFFSGNWAKKFATNPSTTYWTLVVHPVAADRRLRLIAPTWRFPQGGGRRSRWRRRPNSRSKTCAFL